MSYWERLRSLEGRKERYMILQIFKILMIWMFSLLNIHHPGSELRLLLQTLTVLQVSTIRHCMVNHLLYARYLCSRAHSAARPSARATIGYLVYKIICCSGPASLEYHSHRAYSSWFPAAV